MDFVTLISKSEAVAEYAESLVVHLKNLHASSDIDFQEECEAEAISCAEKVISYMQLLLCYLKDDCSEV